MAQLSKSNLHSSLPSLTKQSRELGQGGKTIRKKKSPNKPNSVTAEDINDDISSLDTSTQMNHNSSQKIIITFQLTTKNLQVTKMIKMNQPTIMLPTQVSVMNAVNSTM